MSHAYSARRFRCVVALLTILSIPLVIGGSLLVYQYVKFSVMVDKRLRGERWMIPSRLYARPLLLHEGMLLAEPELLKILNGLKYEQKPDAPAQGGEFSVGENAVTLLARPGADVAVEPVAIVFDKGHVKEIRGLRSKKRYPSQTLEPELITYLFDESREKRRIVHYEELPDHLVKAVLAIEDRRFFSHPGLDPLRIVGAAAAQPAGRELHPRRQHHHAAARQELLPDAGAHDSPQGAGGACSPSSSSAARASRRSWSCT